MAGEWLKFEKATPDKPEVFAIAASLGIDPDAVVGKLIRVWSWFDTHTVDGNGRGVTSPLLDRIAGVTGFVTAMASVGWIDLTDDGVSLPNFDRHTGETAKGRALGAKRAADHRIKSNAKSNGDGVTPALPREEKRREEKKDKGPSKKQEVPLSTWLDSLNGEPAVAADDPIFDWAKSTGIPANWIAVAWWVFESNYADKPKTYADWRAAFRDHCRRDFLRVWRHDSREDRFVLTTVGQTALKEMEAAQ